MSELLIKDGASASKYLGTMGAGGTGDPFFNIPADFHTEVANGNVPGHTIMSAMGEFESGNVDTDGEDICRWEDVGGPARLPQPADIGEQLTFISSSNADNGATTTGVLTVKMHYLDASGDEQTETVTLNGTTGVDTVATDIRFVQDIYALTVGSNGVAQGNITCYKKGGSIANDLYQFIFLGGNKSLVPHRMIPNGKHLILKGWHAEEAANQRCAFKIRSTDMYGVLVPGVFCFKDVAYMDGSVTAERIMNVNIPSLSVIKVSGWSDQAGTEGSCGWWGVLIDD